MNKALMVGAGVLLAGVFFAVQYQSTRHLAVEVEAIRQELAARAPEPTAAPQQRTSLNAVPPGNDAILQRLGALEETVTELVRNSDYLMAHGQLPVNTNKLADLFAKFTDSSASDRDRVQALRVLRRSNGINDEVLSQAMNWARSATNANTRDDILSSLEGLTNSVLRDPLVSFALNDPNASVREQAVDSLRRFVNDPNVEAILWKEVNDPAASRTAIQGIVDGPQTETRIAALQQRASDPSSSLDERVAAWRALRAANQDTQQPTAALVQLAQTSQDPFERAKVMQAFNDAVKGPTSSDAVLLPSLIQGVQDPSPIVREPAVKALKDYRSDPSVDKWLHFVAANDQDPGVRKQAAKALNGK
jgi:HEAT repeat protein